MLTYILTALAVVLTGFLWRRAWVEAKRKERLAALRGLPMPPRPRRRYNESEARLPWGDL